MARRERKAYQFGQSEADPVPKTNKAVPSPDFPGKRGTEDDNGRRSNEWLPQDGALFCFGPCGSYSIEALLHRACRARLCNARLKAHPEEFDCDPRSTTAGSAFMQVHVDIQTRNK